MVKAWSAIPVENPFVKYGLCGKRSTVQLATGFAASALGIGIVFGVPAYDRSRMPPRPESYTRYEDAKATRTALERELVRTGTDGLDMKIAFKTPEVDEYLRSRATARGLRAAIDSVSGEIASMRGSSAVAEYEDALVRVERKKGRLGAYAIAGTGLTMLLGLAADELVRRRKRRGVQSG